VSNAETRTEIHEQFEAICAHVGDWEPLPTVVPVSHEQDEIDVEEQEAPINDLILAGLVAPY
jgi:hypothetical protein